MGASTAERRPVMMFDAFREIDEIPEKLIGYVADSPLGKAAEQWDIPNDDIMDELLELDFDIIKIDDVGEIYSENGELKPNATYILNNTIYKTDDMGRITDCEAVPQYNPDNSRDNQEQRIVGGEDRQPGDQGGHLLGRDINGDPGIGNMIAMDSRINQSDYKRMENDIKAELEAGRNVSMKIHIIYPDESKRPDKIIVNIVTEEKNIVYKFDNDLDGKLLTDVSPNGIENVQQILKDTNGQISSIKEEYDKYGNLEKTTVCITYTSENDEGQKTYRTYCVMDSREA